MCNPGRAVVVIAVLCLSTTESVSEVGVRSHQRGREGRYWKEGCL